MRQAIHKLVEAVRSLKLSTVDRNGAEHLVIGLSREEMSDRLLDLHAALAAYDKDGDGELIEARRMREAIGEIFRWIKIQGLSVDEPLDIVARVLGAEERKKGGGYEIMPAFAPKHVRKRKGWKPQLALPGERLTAMRSLSDHQKLASTMDQVVDRMGAAVSGPGIRG